MMKLFLILMVSIFPIGIAILFFLADYLTHIEMNKEHGVPYAKGKFKDFLCEWEKKKNHPRIEIKDKYATIYNDDLSTELYLWANIIKFDNKCMIFSPIGWIQYKFWERRNLHDSWKTSGKIAKWNNLKQN